MSNSHMYVYRLVIQYPEGSDRKGWWPAAWYTLSDRARRKAIKKGFHWPKERKFLSASSAYDRAWLLRWYGAKVTVQRSAPITWPEFGDSDYRHDIAADWTYHRGQLSPDLPDEDISYCSPEIYYQDTD